LFLRGLVFRGAGNRRSQGDDFIGQPGVDGPGGDGIDIQRPAPFLLGNRFDQAHHSGLGHPIGGEIGPGFGGASAGETHDLGPARGLGPSRGKSPQCIISAVEIGSHRIAPSQRVGFQGAAHFTLQAGTRHQSVNFRPAARDFPGRGLDFRPSRDIAPGGVKMAGMLAHKIGLVRAGQSPNLVSFMEETRGQRAPDA
jgi:hypothetical protein